jgi:hypothetical protein
MDILTEVITNFNPSVSKASIEMYSLEHQKFADPKSQQNQRNAIGFKKYN